MPCTGQEACCGMFKQVIGPAGAVQGGCSCILLTWCGLSTKGMRTVCIRRA